MLCACALSLYPLYSMLTAWLDTDKVYKNTHTAPSFRLHLHNSASITSASAAVSIVRWERVPRQQNEHSNSKPKSTNT